MGKVNIDGLVYIVCSPRLNLDKYALNDRIKSMFAKIDHAKTQKFGGLYR
jgi:hypothetical protein